MGTRYQTTQAISATDRPYEAPPPYPSRSQSKAFVPRGRESFGNSRDRTNALEIRRKEQLDKELVYLQDPLKLAETTINLLRDNDTKKAGDLVRRASKQTSCTVSWNHMIDYEMSMGRIKMGVHLYNEMKKRAQTPDAQTYTILLRGLSWHPHKQDSLPLALKIYHSMFAENCPVKPNIIHTNAVLRACAMARDIDALWGIAAKLPSKGMGAANNLTFTTILNAIRNIAWQNDKDLADEDWEEKSVRRQRAVLQGRRIWEEVIPRWRAGDIYIDEELVCAMGRLLLLGSTERDYDDVLSLAEQVMGLPRQKRRLGEPEQITVGEGTSPARMGNTVDEQAVTDEASQDETRELEVYNDDPENFDEDDEFSKSTPAPVINTALANVFRPQYPSPNVGMARPGRNALSMILDACINLRAIPSAQAYWGLLTDPSGPYNVEPDSENYHTYLRLLRVQRASRAASELIQDMHSGELKSMQLLQTRTFRIALSACARNKRSPRIMENTTPILHIMYKTLTEPDLKCLLTFCDIIWAQVERDFRVALKALRELDTGVRLVRNYVSYGSEDGVLDDATKTAATDFARKLLGLFEKVKDVAGDRLEREEKNYIIASKVALDQWVGRTLNTMDKRRNLRLITSGKIPRPEGMSLVRKMATTQDWRFASMKHVLDSEEKAEKRLEEKAEKVLESEEKAEKVLEGGVKKRMQRAMRARERSREFDDFWDEEI